MNKRAIMLPFIFVYKTLFYIFKAPIIVFKYFFIGMFFLLSLFYKYLIVNSLLGLYATLMVFSYGFIYFCKYFYIGCKKVFGPTDDILLALGNYICKGFLVLTILIYKIVRLLRYIYIGIFATFYYLFVGIINFCKYFYKGVAEVLGFILIKPIKSLAQSFKNRPKKVKVIKPKIVKPQPTMAMVKPKKEQVYRTKTKKKERKKPIKKHSKYVKTKKRSYYKRKAKKKKSYINNLLKNFLMGLLVIFKIIYRFIKYVFIGIGFIFYLVYRLIRYELIGITLPFRIIFQFIGEPLQKIVIKQLKSSRIRQEEKAVQRFLQKKERDQLHYEQIKARNERIRRKAQEKTKRSIVFAKVEKPTFEARLKALLKKINDIPNRIKNRFKEEAKFSPLVQAFKNQRSVPTRQMVIDYEGIDAIKSNKKLLYQYVVRDPNTGKVITGYFDAFSIVEVHSFLISEGYEVYTIKTSKAIQLLHANVSVANRKIKISDLIFMLTQLSTYIKAGLPLVDSLKILAKQYQKKKYYPIFKAIIYDLTMGENFSAALAKQGIAFPKLLINMVKTAEMTGELPETLDDMVNYYTETEQTRKQMISALTYPTIVLIMAIAVLSFIMVYVVPKFTDIYTTMDNASIPAFTIMITKFSKFMQDNIIYLGIGFVILILLMRYLYVNVKLFRYAFQWFGMHIPAMGNIIIYNEVTMFTKTFSSLLSHNVFITDSMEILSRVTNNEIYKILISNTIENLNRGDRISLAFERAWAFPIPAYEMLVTGEKTGQLPEMMKKVSDYYQDLHRNSVTRLKALIEPALIVFLTAIVGVIVMAVVIPMFNMYSSISNY